MVRWEEQRHTATLQTSSHHIRSQNKQRNVLYLQGKISVITWPTSLMFCKPFQWRRVQVLICWRICLTWSVSGDLPVSQWAGPGDRRLLLRGSRRQELQHGAGGGGGARNLRGAAESLTSQRPRPRTDISDHSRHGGNVSQFSGQAIVGNDSKWPRQISQFHYSPNLNDRGQNPPEIIR